MKMSKVAVRLFAFIAVSLFAVSASAISITVTAFGGVDGGAATATPPVLNGNIVEFEWAATETTHLMTFFANEDFTIRLNSYNGGSERSGFILVDNVGSPLATGGQQCGGAIGLGAGSSNDGFCTLISEDPAQGLVPGSTLSGLLQSGALYTIALFDSATPVSGRASFEIASAVPLPAGMWLFITALMGLSARFAVSRRT